MDNEMKSRLRDFGFTAEDLTRDELSQLREQIRAERKGKAVLDGVLSRPEVLMRKLRKGK